MRLDLLRPDAWDSLCEQYRAELPFQDPGLHIQVYQGYRHALWEATQSLARLFPHKKTIAVVERGDPGFESVAAAFSSEGYTVQLLSDEVAESPDQWLPAIQGDLIFILFANDDPVTGRVYRWPALRAALKDKRVFVISLSHALHAFEPPVRPSPFELNVLSLLPERALLIAGERGRVRPQVAEILPWESSQRGDARIQLASLSPEEIQRLKTAVLSFEADLPAGFKPVFGANEERVWDRAVFYHSDFDGWAVADELARALGLGLGKPGAPADIDSFSPCRWESPRLASWWVTKGGQADVMRGLIAISSSLLGPDLKLQLALAAERVRKIQEGE